VASTRDRFSELGLFPSIDDADTIAFSAILRAGGEGIFTARDGHVTTLLDTTAGFESFRGALINAAGTVFFYATPRGGRLGLFAGPDPTADAILSVGDALSGSTVAEFALNPVSINHHAQLAIRIRLANDRQLIVRADPAR
jgi:hypothetical protein